jgi:hypothetical protein
VQPRGYRPFDPFYGSASQGFTTTTTTTTAGTAGEVTAEVTAGIIAGPATSTSSEVPPRNRRSRSPPTRRPFDVPEESELIFFSELRSKTTFSTPTPGSLGYSRLRLIYSGYQQNFNFFPQMFFFNFFLFQNIFKKKKSKRLEFWGGTCL